MQRLIVASCTCLLGFSISWLHAQESETLEPGFRWLFDGQSLQGWEGNEDYFRVQDGAIVAGSLEEKIPHNEFLCTQREFTDFELILEAKLAGEGNNAGIQFRSQRIPDSSEVSGFQCDVGEAFGGPVWGALYDESRRRKMLAQGERDVVTKLVREGEWNELRILAVQDRIQLFLNGQLTVDYKEQQPASEVARSGVIGLQIHSGPPTEAWYRKIRIREL